MIIRHIIGNLARISHFNFFTDKIKKEEAKFTTLPILLQRKGKSLEEAPCFVFCICMLTTNQKYKLVGGRSTCLNLRAPLPLPRVQCMKTQDHDVDDY